MTTPKELSDNELLEQIENCSLSPELFTHETMLRLAWILIQKHGLEVAIVKNATIKERYFKIALKSDKFNKTLTRAYVEILSYFMTKSKTTNFDKLLREFPRLRHDFKNLVKTHYGYNILKEHRQEEPKDFRPILFSF
ncbi:MAG: hypothetical protein CVU08_14260 [Bacteroidetes bacterium HGW-Bacteroidetes-3]|jgi:hypothetical protein|nr:MAG: hypothetical protein CVU08_14260 [Bacteroidetes bacterium HGW-Bacteroidetes-3]